MSVITLKLDMNTEGIDKTVVGLIITAMFKMWPFFQASKVDMIRAMWIGFLGEHVSKTQMRSWFWDNGQFSEVILPHSISSNSVIDPRSKTMDGIPRSISIEYALISNIIYYASGWAPFLSIDRG